MNKVELRIRSRKLGMKASVCVLLPESPFGVRPADYFNSEKKHKVLWLLHGATCDYDDFLSHDSLNRHLMGSDTIVVMPNGLNSDYANHMEFANGYAFADFFFDELMPFIYNTFPASDKPEDNYISGYSMGGAGALMYGLLHPEKFNIIAPLGASAREADFLAPLMDMTGEEFKKYALANRTALPTEYGDPRQGITVKEINMICRYPTVRDYVNSMECTTERFKDLAREGKSPEIYFCFGDGDGCYPHVLDFVKLADALGVDNVSYEVIPGYDHSGSEPVIAHMIEHFGL